MAEKTDQAKPLAPAAYQIDIHKNDTFPVNFMSLRRQKCIKCCGCSAAVLLVLVVTILILMLTIFRVKDPVLKLNSVKVDGLDLLSSNAHSLEGLNLTVVAGISVQNPNVASFNFDTAKTNVYYDGSDVGEVRTPSGQARARRTLRMNVSVDVMVDKVLEMERFKGDFIAGILPLSTYTRISGEVRIIDVIKRSVVIRMNCEMNVNVSSQAIQDSNCRRKLSS